MCKQRSHYKTVPQQTTKIPLDLTRGNSILTLANVQTKQSKFKSKWGKSRQRGVSGLDLKYGERDRGRFLSQIPALYHLNLTSPTLTTQRICVWTFFFFSHGITFVPCRAADARRQQQSAGEKSFALLINTFFFTDTQSFQLLIIQTPTVT